MKDQNEKWIVNVTYTEAWNFTDSEEKAAAILREAELHEKEAAELCERHAANYPDNADYWKRQAERHRAAKFEIMSYEEFTKRQREKLLAGEPKEVTAEDWHDALDVLPPVNWVQVDGVDEFCMSERLTAYYTTQYAHDLRSGKYYCKTVDMYDPNTRNIDTKYFLLTFYKKGTCHIVFKDEKLLEKFNLFAGKQRQWLPPDYGKKPYTHLSEEEKTVADSFSGGETGYNEIYENQGQYLVERSSLMLLSSPA